MSVFDIFAKLERDRATADSRTQPIEWLVVGLGNPGAKYVGTRHNAGFRALDAYCAKSGQRVDKMKFKALAGEGMLGGARVLFLKPQTFMNLSGEAVLGAAAFYKIPPARIIVLSDDISLDVGALRVRPKGSAGGQNGLKNIIYHLGSEEFPRVKIGVGHKPHPDYDLADWVLSKFTADEQKAIDAACRDAVEAAACIIAEGCAAAAQKFNGKRI
ncbi:MAG: aminoacyl-tRNA hydrolase [Eubacteriales bacterium]|nr:aminoacyl-tRNA hydrolase [Eubacteriales bacterium]